MRSLALFAAWAVACSDASIEPRKMEAVRAATVETGAPEIAATEQASASSTSPASASVASSSSAAPSASVVTVPPAARRGLWMWEFGKNAPAPERAAELAASWGVHRVFIKGSNGNVGPRWWSNASKENVAAFADRGIEVWVFGYFYAPDRPDADGRTWGSLDEQVDSILKVALAPGVKGVVVDAEEEFKERPEDAMKLCRLLRAKIGERSLAYTSYGWISPHSKFPFKAFDRHCGDAFLPQVYYAFGWPGDVTGSLERLDKDVRALGLKAPIWPVQSNERDPSVEKMTEFFDRTSPDASIFYMHPDGSPQTAKLGKLKFR
ncbi:MAG: hypothetical protein HOW73_06275 [Polyangiaceae bacterium]|nr:hypothetical protein [Polyangiaceae bacterium]